MGKTKAQQTFYAQIKTGAENKLPTRAALSTRFPAPLPLPTVFGGFCDFSFSATQVSSGVPSWQAVAAVAGGGSSCSRWLLAQPEARRTGKIGGSLTWGFLACLFQALPQSHGKGRIRRQEVGYLSASNPRAFTHGGLPPAKLLRRL